MTLTSLSNSSVYFVYVGRRNPHTQFALTRQLYLLVLKMRCGSIRTFSHNSASCIVTIHFPCTIRFLVN